MDLLLSGCMRQSECLLNAAVNAVAAAVNDVYAVAAVVNVVAAAVTALALHV